MKKLVLRIFLFLLLLSAHGSAATDEEGINFCKEWHGITKIPLQARISTFQGKGFNDESAEIFSRFMTLAYPVNIEIIANFLCTSHSSLEGLRNFHSSEDKHALGLAIKALLVNQGPIYIYAYGILKNFPEEKLNSLVDGILLGINQRFQVVAGQQAMPSISIESLQATFSNQKDLIPQNFSSLLGRILKDLFRQQADTSIMDDSCLQEISNHRFWKGIFDVCDANTVFKVASEEFVFFSF